ncbi:zinc finger domain-containing protein [Streptomyces angustmyceticus]
MREFTNHRAQHTLGILRAFHLETLNFSGTHPEATLADFEHHLRQRVDTLEAELEAGEKEAQAAVVTKPLSGPLADPERQRAFRQLQNSEPPATETEREAWWKQRTEVLDEIKAQGLAEALDWECRNCGAPVRVACRTGGGRPKKQPHFLRATDAEAPYHHAYGLR